MSGLEELVSLIYHEKQQSGSMLCAQHALNSLLQQHLFTAPDLSEIARNLDTLESNMDDHHAGTSTNMDDTGFFSVQVLDRALDVWGLNLVRWRAEDMRKYQEHPHTQLAFILNYSQHWYTLRRFGDAHPNVDEDPGEGHWFNLNSYQSSPEWVSKTYLGMVIQQAEADGYSVFAVMQANRDGPLALPRTEADVVASTLPEPISSGRGGATTSSGVSPHEVIEGVEDEDWELQAALQASLAGGENPTFVPNNPLPVRSTIRLPGSNPSSAAASGILTPHDASMLADEDDTNSEYTPLQGDNLDPVAASMARNQQLLQRMQEEQRMAQSELWQNSDNDEALARRRREVEEEEEMLRRAIEESEAMARQQGNASQAEGGSDQPIPPLDTPPASSFTSQSRIYDDEDAELQAALRASLEDSQGYVPPALTTPPAPSKPPVGQPILSTPAQDIEDEDMVDADMSMDTEGSPAKAVDVDEMRRRRLERFGG